MEFKREPAMGQIVVVFKFAAAVSPLRTGFEEAGHQKVLRADDLIMSRRKFQI